MLRVSIVAAAAIALITATLSAGAGPGVSFQGASAHGGYGVFVQLQCGGGCFGRGSTAVVQLTAGRPPNQQGPCPWGADPLPAAAVVDGRFATGEWLFIAPKTFVWLWVSGRLASPTRLVGRIQGPTACGGRDGYALRAGLSDASGS